MASTRHFWLFGGAGGGEEAGSRTDGLSGKQTTRQEGAWRSGDLLSLGRALGMTKISQTRELSDTLTQGVLAQRPHVWGEVARKGGRFSCRGKPEADWRRGNPI